jgi:hypothetical protein
VHESALSPLRGEGASQNSPAFFPGKKINKQWRTVHGTRLKANDKTSSKYKFFPWAVRRVPCAGWFKTKKNLGELCDLCVR